MKNQLLTWISLGLLSFTIQASAYADSVVKTFKADQIKRLVLKNGAGDNIVVGRSLSEVKVTVERKKWEEGCTLEVTEKSGILQVTVSKESAGFFSSSPDCLANTSITMPEQSDVEITSGSGDTTISDLTGLMDITSGSGDLKIEKSHITKLTARSGSGDLEVSGQLSDLDLKVGSGDVELAYQSAPANGSAEIKTGSGDVTIRMPKNAKINASLQAGSGSLSNEIGQDPKAPYAISMKAGSGDLKIKPL